MFKYEIGDLLEARKGENLVMIVGCEIDYTYDKTGHPIYHIYYIHSAFSSPDPLGDFSHVDESVLKKYYRKVS